MGVMSPTTSEERRERVVNWQEGGQKIQGCHEEPELHFHLALNPDKQIKFKSCSLEDTPMNKVRERHSLRKITLGESAGEKMHFSRERASLRLTNGVSNFFCTLFSLSLCKNPFSNSVSRTFAGKREFTTRRKSERDARHWRERRASN